MSTKRNQTTWQQKEEAKQLKFKRIVWLLDCIIAVSFTGILLIGINVVQMYLSEQGKYVYNCSIADIHPDYTPAMRETCRKQFEKETQ